MVEDHITDGCRIAQLLASELDGRTDGSLDRVAIVNVEKDVTAAEDGARAYDVAIEGSVLASAFVHHDRAHLAFSRGSDAAFEAAGSEGLRTRRGTPTAGPLVLVEDGAEVKRAVDVVVAAVAARSG
jgi:hypothetical protein